MAPRANWKGVLKVAEVICPVALYTAASTSERVALHFLNRATGHRLRREFVDSKSGKPVAREEQVMGYETGKNDYVIMEPDEIAAAIPESDKVLDVSAFVALDDFDDVFLDKPYYLAPADASAAETFALLRGGLLAEKVGAIARTVLHRRVRTLLVRAYEGGMVATALSFDYEVRPAKAAFDGISDAKIKGEMLDLAKHIIDTKRGEFDPSKFDDRYENALAELIKAKAAGKTITAPPRPKPGKVIDLMAALRQSAGADKPPAKQPAPKRAPARRKAG